MITPQSIPQSFAQWCASGPAARLVEMIRRRPDVLYPVPREINGVLVRLSARASIARAVDHLDVPQLRALIALVESAVAGSAVAGSQRTLIAPGPPADEGIRDEGAADVGIGGEGAIGEDTADSAPVADLSALGLIWPASGERAQPDPTLWRIQPELVDLFTELNLAPETIANWPARSPSPEPTTIDLARATRMTSGTTAQVVSRITALLEIFDETPVPNLRAGGIGRREKARLAARLDTTPEDAAWLLELMWGAGLLGVAGSRWMPTALADDWVAKEPAVAWEMLTAAWWTLGRTQHHDAESTHSLLGSGGERAALPAIRRLALDCLAEFEPGEALTRKDMATMISWRRPLASRRWSQHLTEVVDGAIALGLIAIPLRGDRIALSPAGRAWRVGDAMGATEIMSELLPGPTSQLLIQADLTLVVPGVPDQQMRTFLGRVARVDGHGQAMVYRLTRDSVLAGLQSGFEATEIAARLAQYSGMELPQPMQYLIADAARGLGRVRVGRAASYVRTDTPDLLDEVLARAESGEIPGFHAVRLSPTVAVTMSSTGVTASMLAESGITADAEENGARVITEPHRERAEASPPPPINSLTPPDAATLEPLVAGWLKSGLTTGAAQPSAAAALSALREAAATGAPVTVHSVDARGAEHVMTIVPRSVSGGRVRGTRIAAGKEPTEVTLVAHRISKVTDPPRP